MKTTSDARLNVLFAAVELGAFVHVHAAAVAPDAHGKHHAHLFLVCGACERGGQQEEAGDVEGFRPPRLLDVELAAGHPLARDLGGVEVRREVLVQDLALAHFCGLC